MRMLFSLGAVVALVLVMWIVARMLGFGMSLGVSLLLSVGLTLLLNLLLGGFRRR